MDTRYLKLAIDQASKNPIGRHGKNGYQKMAAVLTNGRDIYVGYNQWKTHPMQARFAKCPESIFIHAEIDALVKAVRGGVQDFSGYDMYVARVLKTGQIGLAQPCTGCYKAISHFGVRFVSWTK
jgi:tRNA(Arg) A34 adenosine deaminase TadA